jgi:pimeloyl-ACP methyl ester carboxylesterase
VAVTLVAAACGGTAPAPSASPSASPSSLPKTTLTACDLDGLAARCGTVWVPQDWAHPAGPTMPLQVVVLPATDTAHPAAPLFYLTGVGGQDAGDGNSVNNGMTWAAQAFSQLNKAMDLVFVEQRGTSGSWLEACTGLTSWPASPAAISAAVRRCLASVTRDPRHDSTPEAALDLDQVRKALGYNQINIYGVSYGVTMGLAYLQRFSSHVRTAVLDSGALLNVPLWQQASVHEQQAFDQVAARCAATPACARSYHPAADLAAILAGLNAHPVQVVVTGPSGQRQTATITAADFQEIVMDYLAEVQTAVLLPADLHAFALGQWSQVLARRGWIAADFSSSGLTALQYVTIECGDEWAAMNPATISQQGPSAFVPAEIANAQQLNALCAAWPHDPGVSGTVRSTVPVVFLNGTDDPVDPPATVAGATATMPNALLVAVPDSGHSTLSASPHPACLITDTTAFIQAGQPASAAAWDACTRTLAHELVPFPAP